MLLILLGSSSVTQAETWSSVKKKEVSQSYSVSKNGLLSVENRFGSITVTHWDKAGVSIQVKIESSASDEQVAQSNLDRIKVDIRKDGDKVFAVTTLGETRTSGTSNQQFKIDYYISIPATMNLELNQRFGSINLPEKNEGESNLTVKYGNLKAGSFTKSLNLEAGYSSVTLQDVENAALSFAYCGDVKAGNSKQLTIDSKYSTVALDNTDKLDMKIKYGSMTLKRGRSVSMEVKYSNITIANILEELRLGSLDYSTLRLGELSPNFKRVEAMARFGTLDITIDPKAAFKIDAIKINSLSVSGLNETKHNVEDKTTHFVEINGGGSGVIRFEGNKHSSLKVNAK